jgi:hypothetical protein
MPTSARLVAVAAHGLAGSRTDLPAGPLSEVEWFDLVQGCVTADLVGFLAAAAADCQLPVTAGQADELAVLESERAGLSLLVERRALTMASVLVAAGIDHRIIDGPARRLVYGDAAVRHFRAVQVLVPPGRLDDARALQGLPPSAAGGRPVQRCERLALRSSVSALGQVKGDSSPGTGHDVAGVADAPDLDLIGRLGPAAVVELAGRTVSVLTLEQQLVVACVEMTAAPVTSLVLLRDVAQLALSAGLDSTRTRRLAEASQVAGALADGLALAWSRFDLADKTELSVWALRMAGSRPDRSPDRRASSAVSRGGLAQRVLGRLQTAPAGPTSGIRTVPPAPPATSPATALSPITARPDGPNRSQRSTRR